MVISVPEINRSSMEKMDWGKNQLSTNNFIQQRNISTNNFSLGCLAPPGIAHGKYDNERLLEQFSYGSSVTYHCDPGYFIIGAETVYCLTSGMWAPPLPQCEGEGIFIHFYVLVDLSIYLTLIFRLICHTFKL